RVVLALPAAAPGSSGGLPRTQDVGEGGGGGGQPRINKPPAAAFTVIASARSDGTYKATRNGGPVRIRSTESPAVGVLMDRLYGATFVASVGEPTVAPAGALTVEALGPRDTMGVVQLGGAPTPGATYTVTVPITMDTGGGGETVEVVFDVQVFGPAPSP
ncbi:MAG TPA: hypothetical protein PJ982_20020, partial [Lacipirellulaceae bacterium]|nr:hypothetical protein [Lacipirellulaceae bacterium]